MNLIKDIRLFESLKENIDGESLPSYIGKIYHLDESELSIYILRLLFLLRYNQFSLGDFDHLYLNFTPIIEDESVELSKRSIIIEEKWFRYVDVGCSIDSFNFLTDESKNQLILNMIKKTLKLFTNQDIDNYFKDIIDDNIQFPYKEKINNNYLVKITARIINNMRIVPVLKIYENNNFKKDIVLDEMSRDKFIMQFSTIVIGKSSFVIKPRTSSLSKLYKVTPLKFDLK